jgi:hypothetical protein
MLPQIVTRTAGSIASRMGYIRTDIITRCLAAINQLQVSCGAKFKFLLNVNVITFIIEHTAETKILIACSSGTEEYFPGSLGQSEIPGFGL